MNSRIASSRDEPFMDGFWLTTVPRSLARAISAWPRSASINISDCCRVLWVNWLGLAWLLANPEGCLAQAVDEIDGPLSVRSRSAGWKRPRLEARHYLSGGSLPSRPEIPQLATNFAEVSLLAKFHGSEIAVNVDEILHETERKLSCLGKEGRGIAHV